uniref:CWH43-like N-terminal domain-containing protein n=1 Tax=viral metagenome TaxID=1070528 RepID=A0A6C0LL11_9ZZZZ
MKYEGFVSNSENDQIVEKIFMIFGFSMLTLVVYGALLWAYYTTDRNQYMFISMFSLFVIFYAIIIISIVVINKNNYDALSYTLLFGITIFAIFTAFFIGVFFILKSFNLISSAAYATSATSYSTASPSAMASVRMNPYGQGISNNQSLFRREV